MDLLFDNNTDFDFNEKYLNLITTVINESLHYENFPDNCEISFSLVNNEEIHEINKKFRGIDRPTDVLSFPLIDFETEEVPNNNSNNIIALGDIIVSIDKVQEQALSYNHSFERELAFLTAHSMLHLMGYDHITEPEEKVMFAKQEEILNNLGITR